MVAIGISASWFQNPGKPRSHPYLGMRVEMAHGTKPCPIGIAIRKVNSPRMTAIHRGTVNRFRNLDLGSPSGLIGIIKTPRRESPGAPEESVEFLAGAGTDYLRFALEVTNDYSLIVDRLALGDHEIHHFRCCESRNLHRNYRIIAGASEHIEDNSSKRAATE